MNLPDKFKFKCVGDKRDILYNAEKSGDRYLVSWVIKGEYYSDYYEKESLQEYFDEGSWKIIETNLNGVDAEGIPKNFTEVDLKVGMRVMTKHNEAWVVMPKDDSGVEKFFIDGAFCTDFAFKDILAVYARPSNNNNNLLIGRVRGPLIWKRSNKGSKITSLKESLKKAEAEVAEKRKVVRELNEKLQGMLNG